MHPQAVLPLVERLSAQLLHLSEQAIENIQDSPIKKPLWHDEGLPAYASQLFVRLPKLYVFRQFAPPRKLIPPYPKL